MSVQQPGMQKRDREAADWFARLSRTPIQTEELTAFQRWSRDPDNLAAYNQVEDVSRAVRDLRDDPLMRAAARQALAQPPESRRAQSFGGWRIWGVGLVFATALAVVTLSLKPLQADTYSTKIGEISSVRLEDGTEVRLNTDSTLRVRFERSQRRVELVQGQAFFEVAHDPSRPFVVAAGDAQVRAVGTQFDVRRFEGEVRVVLTEGRVAVVGKRSGETTLTPGQGIVLDGKGSAPRPTSVDVAALTSWRTGTLTFHNQTLANAVQELNRYSKTKIVLDASTPRQLIVSGAFQAGDTHEFIAAATLLYGLKARTRSDGDIELSAAGAS